jgi:pyruvate/2-oxoglutarate/acetoin dehydrogenase E1 component/TPP-dependent pyruvate/acetoin dehydrogenase alpha subunit
MSTFKDREHLYRVLDAFFTRLAADRKISEAMLAGRFVLRFRYREPEGQVTVDLRGSSITWEFDETELQPDLEMIQSGDIAHRFWMGNLSIPRALATREVISRGPVAKALKLLPALKPAYPLYAEVLRQLGEDALLEPEATPVGQGWLPERWLRDLRGLTDRAHAQLRRRFRVVHARGRADRHQVTHQIPFQDGSERATITYRDPHLPTEGPELDREMLARMLLIRAFEQRLSEANARGEVPTEAIHLSIGQEACAVGVCFALRGDDVIATTHRGHGHMLAKGADLEGMMAEMLGKATGLCGGKGGSMHVTDATIGAIGANGIVGASPLIACGAAHSARLRSSDQVAVAFMGDGATNQGMFHEALNFAAVLDLPVVFVVENNLYGEFTPLEKHCRVPQLSDRAAAYGMPGVTVEGNDLRAVLQAARDAVERARTGGGPTLLECRTYRWHGHMEGEAVPYRSIEEIDAWKARCPIAQWRAHLIGQETLTLDEAVELERQAQKLVQDAFDRAVAAPEPGPDALMSDIYSPEPRALYESQATKSAGDREITTSQALYEALQEEMECDEGVYLLGEDVSTGGYFAVTVGLVDRFGPERIVDTPISEYAIVGSAVGAAMTGRRPVAEILFSDFLTTCMDPIVNQAAKLRYMSGGQYRLPLVVRTPGGGGLGMAAQHSQSLEALLTGVPGLIVLAPATPYDAKGLLKAAIRSENPVIFFENKLQYAATGPVPEGDYIVPIGKAEVKRSGSDVTLVSVGAALGKSLDAAAELAKAGIEAEVVDLRSLVPLDLETILESVERTGRLVTVEDGALFHGFGAEVVSRVVEAAFDALVAPPRRVAGIDVPIPYNNTLENLSVPDSDRIVAVVRELLGS